MSKRQILMIIGLWVMAILFLGFRDAWDKTLLVITGLLIIAIAYKMKNDGPKLDTSDSSRSFVEHKTDINNPTKPNPTA